MTESWEVEKWKQVLVSAERRKVDARVLSHTESFEVAQASLNEFDVTVNGGNLTMGGDPSWLPVDPYERFISHFLQHDPKVPAYIFFDYASPKMKVVWIETAYEFSQVLWDTEIMEYFVAADDLSFLFCANRYCLEFAGSAVDKIPSCLYSGQDRTV